MPLHYEFLTGMAPLRIDQHFTAQDTIRYALGIGTGLTVAEDPRDLRYVYELDLHSLPTMAVILAYPGFWAREPKYGITWQKLLHVGQSIQLHAPLPIEGRVWGETTVDEIYDRGAEKGALMHVSRRIFDAGSKALLATVRQVNLLRADGGFGGKRGDPSAPHPTPQRPPDATVRLPTSLDQALIYRLSGDTNPLHADPAVAAAAGFPKPILHGLASFGVAGRAVVKGLCDGEAGRVKRIDVRFSSPVFPGETIETRMWREADERGAFEAVVVERGVVVMRNGYAEFAR
jgi:acyl dehydratase